MSTVVRCEKCDAKYKVGPELAGKTVKCKCGAAIAVPKADAASAGTASAPAASAASGKTPAPEKPAAADPYGLSGGASGDDLFGLGGGLPDPLGGLPSGDPLAGGLPDPLAAGLPSDPLGGLPPVGGGLPSAPPLGSKLGGPQAGATKTGAPKGPPPPSDGIWITRPIVWGPAVGIGVVVLIFCIYTINSTPKTPAAPIAMASASPANGAPPPAPDASTEATASTAEATSEAASESTNAAEGTTAAAPAPMATPEASTPPAATPMPMATPTVPMSQAPPPSDGNVAQNPPSQPVNQQPGDAFSAYTDAQAAEDLRAAMESYGDLVSAHDQTRYESRLKWCKEVRQPVIALRVGVAAVVDESVSKSKSSERGDSKALLKEYTQDLAGTLVTAAQKMIDEGKLGEWPLGRRVKGITMIKSGTREEVLKDAQDQALNFVVAVEITDHGAEAGKSDVGFVVRVMDVTGARRVWSSDPFYRNRMNFTPNQNVRGAKVKTVVERIAEAAEKYTNGLERKLVPTALPELTPDDVKVRLKDISKFPPPKPLPVLAELGWYQLRGWATPEELRPIYELLLAPDEVEIFLTGDASAREAWVTKWLAENES